MQENNFEKQVQQKIDELTLKPSDEVWQKVAASIEKRKGGRRIFVIVFLCLLFISAAIFIITDQTFDQKNNKAVSKQNTPTKPYGFNKDMGERSTMPIIDTINNLENGSIDAAPGRRRFIKDMPAAKKTGNQQKPTPFPVSAKTNTLFAVNNPGDNNNTTVAPINVKYGIRKNTNKIGNKTGQKVNMWISHNNPVDSANQPIYYSNNHKTIVGDIIPLKNDIGIRVRVTDEVSKDQIDIKEKIKDTVTVMIATDNKNDDAIKKSIQLKLKSEWKIGFAFSLGVAATQNRLLGIIGSGSNDESKVYASPVQSNGGSAGPGRYISKVPSNIKSGRGMVLGVSIGKNISPKINFLLGLNYKTYNSAMLTGNKVDSSNNLSANNFFYRSGTNKNYKNHFHFIELPVTIRFKLGKQNKVPLYLNTSVSISRLVGSNALQFDTASGAYYRNNKLFNKTQVNLSAGLLFSLSNPAKNSFRIGPDINFSLNKIANSGLYKNRHYSYFGILVQKNISKDGHK